MTYGVKLSHYFLLIKVDRNLFWTIKLFRKQFQRTTHSVNAGKLYGWVHITANCLNTRGSHRMCSIKKVSLKISQYSQENTCASLFFKQHVYWASLLKNRLWHRSFPVNFATFFRTLFLQNTSGWLLLFYNRCWLYTLQLCIAGNSKVKRGH